MRARAIPLVVAISGSAAIASCGELAGDTRIVQGTPTFLDVYVSPDTTCGDGTEPFCVGSMTVNLTPIGGESLYTCFDVAQVLGAPVTNFQDLSILAGAGIAEGLPASGVVGIELGAFNEECALVGGTATPVIAGYAEIELLDQDQAIFIPVGCTQPIVPCDGTTPTPTPPI